MNITILSRLHFTCPYCSLKYFATSHLIKRGIFENTSNKICRLCCQTIYPDEPVLAHLHSVLNLTIEEVFPRNISEYYIGLTEFNEIRSRVRMGGTRCFPNTSSELLNYIKTRLSKRTRYGEWKTKHITQKTNIVSRSFAVDLPDYLIKYIIEYITPEELAILYRVSVFL